MRKIAFREYGQGPKLVLLHGYAGSVLHWDKVVPELSQKFTVIVPNLSHLYMGKEPLSFSAQVDELSKFIHEHCAEKKVSVVGMSYGSSLAWGVMCKNPHLIDKIVYINPMPPEPRKYFSHWALKYFFKMPLRMNSIYLFLTTSLGKTFLKTAAESFRFHSEHQNERLEKLSGRKLMFVVQLIYNFAWIIKKEKWSNWMEKMDYDSHDSLAIFDDKDPLFEAPAYSDFCDMIGCDRRILVTGAGHIATLGKPKEVAEAILNFFESYQDNANKKPA